MRDPLLGKEAQREYMVRRTPLLQILQDIATINAQNKQILILVDYLKKAILGLEKEEVKEKAYWKGSVCSYCEGNLEDLEIKEKTKYCPFCGSFMNLDFNDNIVKIDNKKKKFAKMVNIDNNKGLMIDRIGKRRSFYDRLFAIHTNNFYKQSISQFFINFFEWIEDNGYSENVFYEKDSKLIHLLDLYVKDKKNNRYRTVDFL